MSQDDFEISQEGVKLSYERFLSDSAGGYVIALIFLIGLLINVPIPNSSNRWQDILPLENITSPVAVLVGLLIVLLGTPVGLLLNAISWFILGWVQMNFLHLWRHPYNPLKFLVAGTARDYQMELTIEFFDINPLAGKTKRPEKRGIYDCTTFLEEILTVYFPGVWATLSHVQGIKQFDRNLAFLFFFVSIYSFLIREYQISFWVFMLTIVLLILASLLEFYVSAAILLKSYLICREQWTTDDMRRNRTFDEIIAALLAASKRSTLP
jgi:hypothetical protein